MTCLEQALRESLINHERLYPSGDYQSVNSLLGRLRDAIWKVHKCGRVGYVGNVQTLEELSENV